MSDVKRYKFVVYRGKVQPALEENTEGQYVLASDYDALAARVAELEEALRWCASHPYAGGKCFGDVEPVKSALADGGK